MSPSFYSICGSFCGDLMPTRYTRSSRNSCSSCTALLSRLSRSTKAWHARWPPLSLRPSKTRVPIWSTLTLYSLFGLKARLENVDFQSTTTFATDKKLHAEMFCPSGSYAIPRVCPVKQITHTYGFSFEARYTWEAFSPWLSIQPW